MSTPTRKWLAARVTAVSGLAVTVATSGWHQEATIFAITIVSAAAVSYLTPNTDQGDQYDALPHVDTTHPVQVPKDEVDHV